MSIRNLLLLGLVLLPWSEPDAGRGRRGRDLTLQISRRQRPPRNPRTSMSNILLLMADDMGVDQLAAYGVGADLPNTPNLDALASGGMLFRNAWSNPVCSPTRAAIMTGRHGFRTGIGHVLSASGAALPTSELTLPEMLDQGTSQAYAHAAFGKWHLGNSSTGGSLAPNQAGYTHFSGTLQSIISPDTYFDWTHVVDGFTTTETSYEPVVMVDETLAWIGAQVTPWFCYASFNLPHDPYHRPPDNLHTVDFTNVNPDPRLEPRPYYKAMVEAMDSEIGRLLAGIPPAVLAQTTVIFLGDNGTPKDVTVAPFLPSHAKSTVFEGGVRVPLIVSGPLVQAAGTECQALVQATDLFGTVAAIAGVDYQALAPATVFDTVSLVPYLSDPSRTPLRSYLYTEIFYPNGEPPSGGLPYLCGQPTTSSGTHFNAIPQPWSCQEDLGFAGPGTARLEICGQELYEHGNAELLIQGPPNALGLLVFAPGFNPMPVFGGTFVPSPAPWLEVRMVLTNSAGRYTEPIAHVPGNEFTYFQAALADPQQPGGQALTNAVRVRMFAQRSAIRNQQFKLLFNAYECEEAFYDLVADPFEQNDLLTGTLDPTQQQNYDQLKAELALLN